MKSDTIHLCVDNKPGSRLLEKHSDARMALAKLINERLSLEERLRHLGEQMQRLQAAEQAGHLVQDRLNALNASEAAAMTAWSRGETDTAPVFDMNARVALESEAKQAAAQAAAARSAAAAASGEQNRLTERLRRVEREVELAKLPILEEVIEPLFGPLEDAARELGDRMTEVDRAIQFFIGRTHALGGIGTASANIDAVRPALIALERMHERVRIAMSRPAPPDGGSHRQLAAFADALTSDPIAIFQARG